MQLPYPARALPRHFNTTVLGASALLMITLVWSFTIDRMAQDKAFALTRSRLDLTNIAVSIKDRSLAEIRNADDGLRIIKYHYEANGAKDFPLLTDYFEHNVIDTDFLHQIGLTDAQGIYIFSNLKAFEHADLSDREHFRWQREHPDTHAPFISRPVIGRVSHKWSMQITRRMEKRDGSFLGVVIASFDPNRLVDAYQKIDLGPNNLIGLIGLDGYPRALRIGEETAQSEAMPPLDLPEALRHAPSGTFVSDQLFDHVNRLYAFERLDDLPLVVLVGMHDSKTLGEYWRNQKTLLLSSGLLSGLILLFVGVAMYYIREARKINDALSESYRMLGQTKREELDMSRRLTQSEKLAALGQLSAGVAHEINNPMGFIGSNLSTLRKYADIFQQMMQAAQALRRGEMSAEAFDALQRKLNYDFVVNDLQQMLAETEEGVVRVKKIVNDLKNFARADNQQEWEFNNLHDGLLSTLNIINHEIKYRADVRMDWVELPPIECIPSQINQVFLNLIVNAAQAIPEGRRGTIQIRSGTEGERVWIEVEDDGSGMTPEQIDRIFEPYYTTKPQGVGTGLGLSVSLGIVQRHNGNLVAFSAPGRGSCFRVTLPLHQPPSEATAS